MSADAVAAWSVHLDRLQAALTDATGSLPDTETLPPLPAELAPRAQELLMAVRATAADLAARRDAVARELADLGASRPHRSPPNPVYLDATG